MKSSNKIYNILSPILGLILLVSLTGCPDDSATNTTNRKNTVLVYCDFTTSLNAESAKYIQNYGEWIISTVPAPAELFFYEISRVEKPPFFKKEIKAIDPNLDGFKKKLTELDRLDSLKNYQIEFRNSVNKLKSLYNTQVAYQGANSCIINSFLHADKYLATNGNFNERENKNYVVVISDMIEECENSALGKIYMNTRNAKDLSEKFENLSESITEKSPMKTNLTKVQPLVMLITRQDQQNPFSLDQNKFEGLWKSLLEKLSFSQEGISKWHFLPQTPSDGIWNK